MVILFSNQKGGCGKTVHCLHFAHYLSSEKNIKDVLVLDLDNQRSLTDSRIEDIETYENEPLFEILDVKVEDAISVLKDYKKINQGYILADLPGRIDDDAYSPIFEMADIIIVPYKYDRITIKSTAFFIEIMNYLQIPGKMFFIPNNIKKSVKYDFKKQINEKLKNFGIVTPEVGDRVILERSNTLVTSEEAMEIVKPAYDVILKNINIK